MAEVVSSAWRQVGLAGTCAGQTQGRHRARELAILCVYSGGAVLSNLVTGM